MRDCWSTATNFIASHLLHMYRKNSFFISGYLNHSAQLLVHLKWSKAKSPFPKLWKRPNWSIFSKCNWTQTFHQSFTSVRSLTCTTRSIEIKPSNSEQATKTTEPGQARKFCISGRSTKATSFILSSTGVEAIIAHAYSAVQNEEACRR